MNETIFNKRYAKDNKLASLQKVKKKNRKVKGDFYVNN